MVLALTCVTLVLHWLQKSPCRQPETWGGYGQLSRFCYSDVMALYGAPGGLSTGGLPYLDYPLEYPVLTGVFMTVIGAPVHLVGRVVSIREFVWFYDLTALVLLGCAVATVVMILRLRRRRPWDAAMFAVSPALLLTATVNWDLLAVALAVGGIAAWSRRRPELAGLLLGLGAAAKLWPGFILLPLIFLGLRTGYRAAVKRAVGYGIGAWVGVNLPIMFVDYLSNGSLANWAEFLRLNTTRPIDWGTLWYVARYLDREMTAGVGPFEWLGGHVDPHLNWLTYGLFGLACVGLLVLTRKAPQPPRLAALALLTVAAFLLFNKVWSQQFVLWLLPLVVLARPRWGAFVAWQAAEVVYFFAFYGQLIRAEPQRPEDLFVMPEGWFIIAAAGRWVSVAVLCGLVVYDILHPGGDPVRRSYGGDPDAGGFADGHDQQVQARSGDVSGGSQPEDDQAADLLPADAEPVAGGLQRPLPGGTGHPVRQDDDRRHPE